MLDNPLNEELYLILAYGFIILGERVAVFCVEWVCAHFVSYICRYARLFLVAVGKLFVFDIKHITMLVLSLGDCREWAIIKIGLYFLYS